MCSGDFKILRRVVGDADFPSDDAVGFGEDGCLADFVREVAVHRRNRGAGTKSSVAIGVLFAPLFVTHDFFAYTFGGL